MFFVFFQKGNYSRAFSNYQKIISYLQYETGLKAEEAKERDQLLLAAHLNLAMCSLKLHNFCDVGVVASFTTSSFSPPLPKVALI